MSGAIPERRDVSGGRARIGSRLVLVLLAVLMVMAAVAGRPLLATAQATRSFVWDCVDVTVAVQQDGALHVIERDRAIFSGGPYRRGFRDIPLARIERIDHVGVATMSGNRLLPM